MRRIAVLSAFVLAGGLLDPSTALAADQGAAKDEQVQWIAVEDEFAVVLPDGETFTGEEGPMNEEMEPPVGTRLFISEVLYETDDGSTRGDEVGRTHIECTFQVHALHLLCDIAWVLDAGSQLHGTAAVDFSEESSGEALQFDIAVTGGTEDFFGATGVVALTDLTDPDDPNAETETLYEADLVLPDRK
jgi:hypothetical protein